MKAVRLIVLTCILGFFLSKPVVFAQDRKMVILEKFIQKRAQYNAIAYAMQVSNKSFSMEDTVVREAKVEVARDQADSIFGGYLSIEFKDSLWFGYDGRNIYRASVDDSTLTIGDPIQHPGLFIKSTWVDNFIDYGFIQNSTGPKTFLQDTTIKKIFIDTTIQGLPCLGMFFKLPDEEGFTQQRYFAAIDTVDYMIRSRMYSVFFQENEQYTNWLYKEIHYLMDSSLLPRMEHYVSGFKRVETYDPDTTFETRTSDFDFAQLQGKIYNSDSIVKLSDTDAKFIILDFWYTSCYPCIKGIPVVNKIYKDYLEKGVAVYGVNMMDDEQKSKTRLEKFFKNNPMSYTPLMIDPKMADQVGIRAYPTLLVLDSDLKIIHKEDGYSDDLYDRIAAVLNERL